MFSVHKTLGGAPGVSDCCACHFTSALVDELATIRGRWLEVYQIDGSTLKCVGKWQLYGDAGGLVPVQLPFLRDGRVGLLIAFKEAKLSIVEYVVESHTIQTVSLHSFEREDYKQLYFGPAPAISLQADPSSKCVVTRIYNDKLAVMPFAQRDVFVDDEDRKLSAIPFRPSFVISLAQLSTPLTNIKDMVFLHGYLEPTVAILYETDPTWTGLLHERKDTCRVAFLTLDTVQNKNHTVLYTSTNLPYSVNKLVPVPAPVSGVLVVGNTSLIHLGQSSPKGVGVALNAYASGESQYTYHQELKVMGLSPAGSRFHFLAPTRLLMSTIAGQLWLVELVRESGAQISSFSFEMICESVVASCFATITPSLFFIGSSIADSLLIERLPVDDPVARERQAAQDALLDASSPVLPGDDVTDMWSDQALSLLRKGQIVEVGSINDQFCVLDTLFTVAAVSDCAVGRSQLDGQDAPSLVATSGFGKPSALAVVNQRIHARVLNRFELKNWSRMWTVRTCAPDSDDRGDEFDKYLVLSNNERTTVLAAGEELRELDELDFVTDRPSIEVSTIGHGDRIIQVLPKSARMLDADGKLVQDVAIGDEGANAYVISARICDRYISLMFNGGRLTILTLEEDGSSLTVLRSEHDAARVLTAMTLHTDTSSALPTVQEVRQHTQMLEMYRQQQKQRVAASATSHKQATTSSTAHHDYDDIDLDLYGPADGSHGGDVAMQDAPQDDSQTTTSNGILSTRPTLTTPARTFALLCWDDGSFEILLLPTMERVFYCCYFSQLPAIVQQSEDEAMSHVSQSAIHELGVAHTGSGQCGDTYLLVRTAGTDIVSYRVALASASSHSPLSPTGEGDTQLGICMNRTTNGMVTHRAVGTKKQSAYAKAKRRLCSFSNVGGYSGAFFANGQRSAWIMVSPQSGLVCLPADGSEIMSFSTFHNVNCPRGFLLLTTDGMLCMATLPEGYAHHNGLSMRKVSLSRTAHHITFDSETSTYTVVTSQPTDFTLTPEGQDQVERSGPSTQDGASKDPDKKAQELRSTGAYLPQVGRYSIELISPITFETIDRFEFEEHEQAIALCTVMLECKQVASGRKHFLAVGTSLVKGEDVAVQGKIYIFDVIEVVPEPGKPHTNHKYKMLTSSEVKGPVSAFTGVNGHLVAATGQKIIVYDFEDMDTLVGIAFLDVNIYATTLAAVKNFIILGDAYKSVWFILYQEDPSKLHMLGKDYHPLQVSSAEFLLDESLAQMVVSDDKNILYLLSYAPYNIQSAGGNKLLRRGDFRLGTSVARFVRLRMQQAMDDTDNRNTTKMFTLYVGRDGTVGAVCPSSEKVFKRLLLLYGKMATTIAQPAGLNPRGYRHDIPEARTFSNSAKTILDMDLLYDYLALPRVIQEDIVHRVGTSVDRMYGDLRVLQEGWQIL
ncbi:mRNA cleavage and polyadenylation factor subunit [Sorochytrium milnesiophthora]